MLSWCLYQVEYLIKAIMKTTKMEPLVPAFRHHPQLFQRTVSAGTGQMPPPGEAVNSTAAAVSKSNRRRRLEKERDRREGEDGPGENPPVASNGKGRAREREHVSRLTGRGFEAVMFGK